MKILKVLGREVSIDTEKLSKGLCEMHNEDEGMKAMLAFGMLDAKLCEMMEENLTIKVKEQFSELTNELYSEEINKFTKDCNSEITKGVYKYAKMVV